MVSSTDSASCLFFFRSQISEIKGFFQLRPMNLCLIEQKHPLISLTLARYELLPRYSDPPYFGHFQSPVPICHITEIHVVKNHLAIYISSCYSYVFVSVFCALRKRKTKTFYWTLSLVTIWKDIPILGALRRLAENQCKLLTTFGSLFYYVGIAQTYGIANLWMDNT